MINRKYLAGFFDAEGMVALDKSNRHSYRINTKISQNISIVSDKLMEEIKETFGGFYTLSSINHVGNIHRSLSIYNDKAYILLSLIRDFTIIKQEQIDLAIQWSENEEDSAKIKTEISSLKRVYLPSSDEIAETLSLDYIAGFFDGDGLVGIYPNGKNNGTAALRVNLTQNATIGAWRLFNRIIKDFGGHIGLHTSTNGTLYLKLQMYTDSAYVFLSCIKKYTILKKEQIRVVLDWADSKAIESVEQLSEEEKQKNIIAISTLRELKRSA